MNTYMLSGATQQSKFCPHIMKIGSEAWLLHKRVPCGGWKQMSECVNQNEISIPDAAHTDQTLVFRAGSTRKSKNCEQVFILEQSLTSIPNKNTYGHRFDK